LKNAEALTARVLAVICPYCERVQVAGSVRRKRPEVHDIDILLIPKPLHLASIVKALEPEKVLLQGPKLTRLLVEGVQVDLYVATPETWGAILLVRTGSPEHNIRLCSIARSRSMKFSAARGVIKEGRVVASRTEEEIFQALGIDYVPPENRET